MFSLVLVKKKKGYPSQEYPFSQVLIIKTAFVIILTLFSKLINFQSA